MTTKNTQTLSLKERIALNHKAYEEYLKEKVEVSIPLGAEKYGTTTTASCDGVVYEIKLGETVKVPRKLAYVIKQSIASNIEVQKKIEQVSKGTTQIGEY